MDYYKLPRLYSAISLKNQEKITLDTAQTHYLKNVMRRKEGDQIRLFDGKNGEFLASLASISKKETLLNIDKIIKEQPSHAPQIHLFFAPLEKKRMDFVIEKTVELGVTHLHPVITNRTEIRKIKTERIEQQIIEASEQSERLTLPSLSAATPLMQAIQTWKHDSPIQWACERDSTERAKPSIKTNSEIAAAFLIGPVGGFDDTEIDHLSKHPAIQPITLGPSILRAETASILCLSATLLEQI
jgi:16S rRNA (uracil1498-N3)-methyltransferase